MRLIYDLPREAYDALPGDNWSSLRRILTSPAHYKAALDGETEDTDAMKFGRAAHLALLEPGEFAKSVVTWVGGRRAGKEWDAFCAEHAGKEIVTPSEAERLRGIVDAVAANEWVLPFLDGRAEVSMTWDLEVVPGFKVPCKGRLDLEGSDFLLDLKVVRDASRDGFGRYAWNGGLLGQAAFYSRGYELCASTKRFGFLAVESQPPYCVGLYWVTPEQMAAGRELYERAVSLLSLCRLRDEWPGYATGPEALTLPGWAAKQAEAISNEANLEGVNV